ncbi:MAG: hypothetical protein NC908_03695 [Candidatus Omnitrophica bacterium]|nr:hypothetical protein [Candidatus Omnitrophota bacterium]
MMILLTHTNLSKLKFCFYAIFIYILALWPTAGALALIKPTYSGSGYIFNRVYQDTEDDNPYEKQQDIEARIRLENKLKFEDCGLSVKINLEGRYEILLNEGTDKEGDIFLKEAYFKIEKPKFSLALGRQIVSWGKLDEVVVLDRLSPQEYKRFILYGKEERKIPQAMLKFNYFGNGYRFETIVLPVFKASDVRFFGSDWSIYNHLLDYIKDGKYPIVVKDTVGRIKIKEDHNLNSKSLDNIQVGLRLRSKISDIDYGLYYMNLFHSIATLRENTTTGNILKRFINFPTEDNLLALVALGPTDRDLTLILEHPRTQIIGIDAETVLNTYGIRAELAMCLEQPYLRDDFAYTQKDTLTIGIGLDHTTPGEFYFNIQFIENCILGYEPLFPDERNSHQVNLNLSQNFFRDKFIFTLKHGYNLSYRDWMLNPKLTYKIKPEFELSLSGFIFEGGATTLFGRFRNKDLVYLEIRYRF